MRVRCSARVLVQFQDPRLPKPKANSLPWIPESSFEHSNQSCLCSSQENSTMPSPTILSTFLSDCHRPASRRAPVWFPPTTALQGGHAGSMVEAFSSFGKERTESRPPSCRKVSHPQIGFALPFRVTDSLSAGHLDSYYQLMSKPG